MRLFSVLRQAVVGAPSSSAASAATVAFDVIVVGGGHAGCEAAAASARHGRRTLLLTHRLETIGEMSCNPSFGGIGKGHLMRELDALDGLCARLCDLSGCHYKVLNRRQGPAVYGLRAQIDRKLYKRHMQQEIFSTPNLTVQAGAVEDLLIEENATVEALSCKHTVTGVILEDGSVIRGKAVVITTGTFLKGEIFLGLDTKPAGRVGDRASYGLSQTLDRLGFRLGRLKTGTPPRLDQTTVNFDSMIKALPDKKATPFSFMNRDVWIPFEKQLSCYITHSNEAVATIVKENAPFNKHIQMDTTGPRYCPSLESKILRFGEGKVHQFWMEPEGFDNLVIYPQGMSMTFYPDVQQRIINAVHGLEKARIVRPGYGVQYDYVDPRQLAPSLETKLVGGLFLAGQINGTTGYEEAASQGIIAGINAACLCVNEQPLVLNRCESYIGVLIDDLTSMGTTEPYRMFTSRVEFRLHLRPDNADLRLTPLGLAKNIVGQQRREHFSDFKRRYDKAHALLTQTRMSMSHWSRLFPNGFHGSSSTKVEIIDALHFITAFKNSFDDICAKLGGDFACIVGDEQLQQRLSIESVYRHFVDDYAEQMQAVRREAAMCIPEDMDYGAAALHNVLSFECREKLVLHRPTTIAAASRIPGMTPTSLFGLYVELKRRSSANQATGSRVIY